MSTLATLTVKLMADTGQFIDDMGSAQKGVGGFLGAVGKNVQSLGKVALGGLGVVAGAAGTAGAAILKLASDAAPLETIKSSFAGIAEASGTSQAAMLKALEEGSAGMIAQRDLMLSYNKAAQLVSPTFANQLPDAMGALSKVAASTGQDLGFLLDSLVTGVGRLSPMILDNLGIQVDLTAAYEAFAKQQGITVDEMSKTQQQAALMAQVQEKLAQNTAALPEVAGTAAAGIAGLRARLQNAADTAGGLFVPILGKVLDAGLPLIDTLFPVLIDLLQTYVVPLIDSVVGAFMTFIGAIQGGASPLDALRAALETFLPPELVESIFEIIGAVQKFWAQVEPLVSQAAAWIGQNVKLQDVLIALGIAIAAVIIPALISIVTTAAPVIAVAIALIAAVAGLRAAWETDFLGIRTFVTETIAAIQAFWAEHGDAILAKAREIWEGVVGVFEWFKGIFTELYEAFSLAFQGDWYGFGEKLREIWDEVWGLIKGIGEDTWQAIKTFFAETDWAAVAKSIIDGIVKGISNGVEAIKSAARSAAQAALEAAKGFLGIHSRSTAFLELGRYSTIGFAAGLGYTDPITRAAQELGRISLASTRAASSDDNSRHFEFNLYGERVDERSVWGAYEHIRAMEGA